MIYPTNGYIWPSRTLIFEFRMPGADTSAMMKMQRGGPPWFAAVIIEHERTPQ